MAEIERPKSRKKTKLKARNKETDSVIHDVGCPSEEAEVLGSLRLPTDTMKQVQECKTPQVKQVPEVAHEQVYQVPMETSDTTSSSQPALLDMSSEASTSSIFYNLTEELSKISLEGEEGCAEEERSSTFTELNRVSPEAPHAPSAPETEVLHNHHEADLPADTAEVEREEFSASFENCVDRVAEDQALLPQTRPFTEEQLQAFYENQLLSSETLIVESFLDCRRNMESHPLHHRLTAYLRSRLSVQDAVEELEQLNKDAKSVLKDLWLLETKRATFTGHCSDGKQVKAQDEYPVAHFSQKAATQLNRTLKQKRESIQNKLSINIYESQWWKLRIDELVTHSNELTEHGIITVLFYFLRRLAKDRVFIDSIKRWLNYVASNLLKRARKQDYLFLAHHALRCPTGFARWVAAYLQTPAYNAIDEDDERNVHHVDVVLALLSVVCKPIRDREQFLEVDTDRDQHWVWLDSDGEDDEHTDSLKLTDGDLLLFINQLPLANVFRFAFKFVKRDERDVRTSRLEPSQWLRALAIFRKLISIISTGLSTYGEERYKSFAKKLGQLALHIVSNVIDIWAEEKPENDPSFGSRLLIEYEHVITEGLSVLINSRNQRSWQLLSRTPLNGMTSKIRFELWMRWHSEITNEPVNVKSIRADSFWNLLGAKLSQLPEPDLFVFLVTLSTAAAQSSDKNFVQLIAWELTELGLIQPATRDVCFRTTKDLLGSLIAKNPLLVSFVLERLQTADSVPAACLNFFKDSPLDKWVPTAQDFRLLSLWLSENPLDSVRHQAAVTIFTRLNWGLDNGVKPFLAKRTHQQMALLLAKVVLNHGRLANSVPTVASSLIIDSVQFLSSFTRSWTSFNLIQWAWQMVVKLKLHAFECHPAHLQWMIRHPQRAFRSIKKPEDFEILKNPTAFSCYVALSSTSIGHSLPEFGEYGVDLLVTLSNSDQPRAVLSVLDNLFPLLIASPDVVYNQPKLLDVIYRLIQTDFSYYKRAKNLLTFQFPGTVLQLLGSLIENTITKLNGLNLEGTVPASIVWQNVLTRLPRWNTDRGVLYLLDLIARVVWSDPLSTLEFKQILLIMLEEPGVQRPSKGIASRVAGWMSGTSEAVGQLDATELIAVDHTRPFLSWIVLELEHGRQSKFWKLLTVELQPDKTKSVDQTLKSVASHLKIAPLTANQLSLSRYAQMACDLSMENPIYPAVVQRFFSLYFSRPEVGTGSWAVGQRVLTSNSSLSALLKQLVLNWTNDALRLSLKSPIKNLLKATVLWLEDVRLLEPDVYLPSLSANYQPARLLQVFQQDVDLWTDLCDVDTIRFERFTLYQMWNKEKNYRVHPSLVHDDPAVRREDMTSRLLSYPEPKPLEQERVFPPFNRLAVSVLADSNKLRKELKQSFRVIVEESDRFGRLMAELTALDCQYLELMAEQYAKYRYERNVTVVCSGTANGPCSGAALVTIAGEPWRVNPSARNRAETNRQEAARLNKAFQEPSLEWLCCAALLLDDVVEFIRSSVDHNVNETGANLFYMLVELVTEETNTYLPAKQLLSTCIEGLGQRCISGNPGQCRNLVALLSNNPSLAGMIAPHFTPSTENPSNEAIQAYLDSYQLVTALSKQETDLILVLLTKFDVRWWLNCSQCWPNDRSRLLDVIMSALDSYGPEPVDKMLATHEILRRHLQTVVLFNFPEQYHRVLSLIIRSSEAQCCSTALWCDLINALGQGSLKFHPKTPVNDFRLQVLDYITQQSLLDIQLLTETARILSEHFSRERQLHGLYGLYPKYRVYVHVMSCFQLMIGHALCFATLQNDAGTPSNILVARLWTVVRDLYAPWILPYTQQQVSDSCATWIQQLSSDRKLLLPWIAADCQLAASVLTSVVNCAAFIHETLPAQQSVLSHVLAFYLHGYCHSGVKSHIYQVVHQALESLPWQSFVPSVADLEQLVRATGQFLPEVHSFLVGVFVRCPLAALVAQWNAQPGAQRFMACLLHLYVRLASEPNAQHNPLMKRVLEEACSYPWQVIDAGTYDQVLNWYISTCDPLFVIQPFMERWDSSQSGSNDPLVFRLLQSSSGYKSSEHVDSVMKRQMFVRSWIRLVGLTVSRYRTVVQQNPDAVPNSINALLDFIIENNSPAEYPNAVKEYIAAMTSSSPVAESLQQCLCVKMGRGSRPVMIETVLRLAAPLNVTDLKRKAFVLEASIENFQGSRDDLFALLKPCIVSNELFAVCWQTGCLVTWYSLTTLEDYQDDASFQLEQLLKHCKSLEVSETIEAKLCLVYDRLSALLESIDESGSQTTAILSEFSQTFASWAEENTSWLSTIGLGKAPKLTNKGRCLARVMVCCLEPTVELFDQLEKWSSYRYNMDCKPAVDCALEDFKSGAPINSRAVLHKLVPLLYSRTFLSRLLTVVS